MEDAVAALLFGRSEKTVVTGKNHASCLLDGRFFACTRGESLIPEYPETAVEKIPQEDHAARLVMGNKTMRGWAVVSGNEPRIDGTHDLRRPMTERIPTWTSE